MDRLRRGETCVRAADAGIGWLRFGDAQAREPHSAQVATLVEFVYQCFASFDSDQIAMLLDPGMSNRVRGAV